MPARWRRLASLLAATPADAAWVRYGEDDPYFGVLSDERYRASTLDDEARAAFFASGEGHVERLFSLMRERVHPDFAPRRALDFGCGVGRVAIPLARRCEEVVGVDVSAGMLREAARNAAARGVRNLVLEPSDDRLSRVAGTFDLVHSFIVFQHVPPARGERVLRQLVARLEPGGAGALHFTYARRASAARRALQRARAALPLLHVAANVATGRRAGEPLMQMNEYSLSRVFAVLQDAGCHRIEPRFTDHGGHRGVLLLFRKLELPLL